MNLMNWMSSFNIHFIKRWDSAAVNSFLVVAAEKNLKYISSSSQYPRQFWNRYWYRWCWIVHDWAGFHCSRLLFGNCSSMSRPTLVIVKCRSTLKRLYSADESNIPGNLMILPGCSQASTKNMLKRKNWKESPLIFMNASENIISRYYDISHNQKY